MILPLSMLVGLVAVVVAGVCAFTAVAWTLIVALPCTGLGLAARAVRRRVARRRAHDALGDDCWERFERQFRAYCRR